VAFKWEEYKQEKDRSKDKNKGGKPGKGRGIFGKKNPAPPVKGETGVFVKLHSSKLIIFFLLSRIRRTQGLIH